METRPIDTPIVPLEHVLDHHVVRPKQLRLNVERGRPCPTPARPRLTDPRGDLGRSIPQTRNSGTVRRFAGLLLAESRRIPHPHGLIEGGGHDEILGGMERRAHDVVVVSRQHAEAAAPLKVPQTQRLIVGRAQYPRKLMGVGMELDCADVIQMSQQSEQASSQLVIPHFDLVIVSPRDDEGIAEVKVNAADGAVVLLKPIDDRADTVVP
mmetsp:Transcript_53922/g.161368  ORF Transcript_53922/g.161368 Transcript_53922/m.161368 type:complete len:210 (+) Transcript_53922:165-794(+)